MGGFTDVSCHLQTPRHYGTFPWASRKGRTGTRPYQKPDQKIRVLCQEELISLQSSAHAEALRPDSCIQGRGTRKVGRIGRAKERKERGKGREVNKVSCSLLVGALWPVVCVRRRPEIMPAHTQTQRAEDKHTDRQTSADNTVLGFRAP